MNTSNLSMSSAHQVWVDLTTRISSQGLHFRSGTEESALASIVDVFRSTRALMKESAGADEFLRLSGFMLETIRPYTARWHGLLGANEQFASPAARRQFRTELLALQPRLAAFADLFDALAKGHPIQIPSAPSGSSPHLGKAVPLGISGTRSAPKEAGRIDEREHDHVAARRGLPFPREKGPLYDGSGLALSGGGIRSATFCLGIVQVLAEKGLLPKFDYLSTVSGGGYLGSFLSNQFTDSEPAPDSLGKDFDSRAKESAALRHLRNSSKYLLPKTTLDSLKLAAQLLSGMLATALLTAVIPVGAAFIVRLIAHFTGFSTATHDFLMGAAVVSGLFVALAWLARPLKVMPRSGRAWLDGFSALFGSIAALALAIGLTPWLLEILQGWRYWQLAGFTVSGAAAVVTGAAVVKAMRAAWKYRKALSRLFMFSGIVLFTVIYLWLVDTLGLERAVGVSRGEWVLMACLAIWFVWAFSINLNETGLHRYYRDKLAQCYLDAPALVRRAANPPALSELSERLPYHLINTTVNLTSSANPELRGRGGDFFLLSKFYCGSPVMGYAETATVAGGNPDLDLATAMAISGAAASTNMGWQTMREYRTLMAIFNVRLGYWLKWPKNSGFLGSNAFAQLMREILGLLNDKASSINLSDGGHIENLAAYELIRRKMRFIVCVDGGMDGEMTCSDLNRLQRLVAIDFGYRIDFDVNSVTLLGKYVSDYGLMAKIDYTPHLEQADKEFGWMLYIKLGMLGTEPNYVMDYRRENPVFPHQTTADQFFDEAQFEAYRKLGEGAARHFFGSPFGEPKPAEIGAGRGFDVWFQSLAQSMLRDTDPVFSRP